MTSRPNILDARPGSYWAMIRYLPAERPLVGDRRSTRRMKSAMLLSRNKIVSLLASIASEKTPY